MNGSAPDSTGGFDVVAIIQARMGSKRLPGKVLRRIGGYTLLQHVVHRLRQVPSLQRVAVATTRRSEDDAILRECERLGVCCFRGPGADVLRRYLMAADLCRANFIVRATADNPVIDPGSVERIIQVILSEPLDYVSERGLPKGCRGEVFSYAALWRTASFLSLPRYREHVTLAMKECRSFFKTAFLSAPEGVNQPGVNLSIDTEDEYRFVRTAMEGASPDVLNSSLPEILSWISVEGSSPPAAENLGGAVAFPV